MSKSCFHLKGVDNDVKSRLGQGLLLNHRDPVINIVSVIIIEMVMAPEG